MMSGLLCKPLVIRLVAADLKPQWADSGGDEKLMFCAVLNGIASLRLNIDSIQVDEYLHISRDSGTSSISLE
jgi:hypothetical protein